MSEGIYQHAAIGRQSAVGTAVAATKKFPVETGWMGFELNRGEESPEEDYGSTSREQPGREQHGVRIATASMPFTWNFENGVVPLESHLATVAPTGGGPYVYTYVADESADLLSSVVKPVTIEYGVDTSTQDEWRAYGCVIDELELGFDALTAGSNALWKGSASWIALNREYNAMTGSLTAPSALEAMEGHLTTLAEGDTTTAFASLSPLTGSLKAFRLRSKVNAVIRAYGGTSDIGTSIGRNGFGSVEFEAMVGISSATKTAISDTYHNAATTKVERRWRIAIDGAGNNAATIDMRVRFRATDRGDHEGERLYAVKGVAVMDSTLAGRLKVIITNDVSAHA